jgi:hypothetical protein
VHAGLKLTSGDASSSDRIDLLAYPGPQPGTSFFSPTLDSSQLRMPGLQLFVIILISF